MSNSCPLCLSVSTATKQHSIEIKDVQYTLWECSSCVSQFWTPFTNPGAEWYGHDKRYSDRNTTPILEPNKKHKDVIHYFKNRPGKVLDIGCGVGNFLAHARNNGWVVKGIDFDSDAVEAGKKTFDLPDLQVSDLNEFIKHNQQERFDLVTLFDVLEHVDDPRSFIGSIKSVLNFGRYVAISVPNRDCARWLIPHDLPPRHLTRWSPKVLSGFLQGLGFKVVFLRKEAASIYFITLKLKNRFGKWSSFNVVEKVRNNRANTGVKPRKGASKTEIVHLLAKVKDLLLFGIPATVIYLILLPTNKRYTDFYVIAQYDKK